MYYYYYWLKFIIYETFFLVISLFILNDLYSSYLPACCIAETVYILHTHNVTREGAVTRQIKGPDVKITV